MTVAIACFAFWQVKVYCQMRDHTKEIERAYISLSHVRVPSFDDHGASIHVKIKNRGHTPGEILGGRVEMAIGKIQPPADNMSAGYHFVPLTEISGIPPAFLGPDAEVEWNPHLPVTPKMLESQTLWLMGEVDYRDRFNGTHRFTYGRRYDRSGDEPRLVFDESTRGMNDDRPLTSGQAKRYAKNRARSEG